MGTPHLEPALSFLPSPAHQDCFQALHASPASSGHSKECSLGPGPDLPGQEPWKSQPQALRQVPVIPVHWDGQEHSLKGELVTKPGTILLPQQEPHLKRLPGCWIPCLLTDAAWPGFPSGCPFEAVTLLRTSQVIPHWRLSFSPDAGLASPLKMTWESSGVAGVL
jgi:hypothetical protein